MNYAGHCAELLLSLNVQLAVNEALRDTDHVEKSDWTVF
jgi:hypothetical protein